jgi:hypothetical protein
MNGRVLYSGGVSNVNNFNETFTGLLTRTYTLQEIDTGGLANGALAHNKRVNVSADYGVVAEINKYFSVSDSIDFWDFRVPGSNSVNSTIWAGTATTPNLNILTPLSAVAQTTTNAINQNFLNQKITSNTALLTATVTREVKLSGGWRFKTRNVTDGGGDDLTWHENWAILGAVVQPSHIYKINVNFESMDAKSANALTTSNTFTREAPDKSWHLRARTTVKPAKWINFSVTGSAYSAKNDDPLVNHFEHNDDVSFGTSIMPLDGLSFDINYAHDVVYSQTDICYIFTPSATAPLPVGATNSGTCVNTAANPGGSPSLYLGYGYYHAPSNFIYGAVRYSPDKYFTFNGGYRRSGVNGSAEQLNPLMVPGALQSKMTTPYVDAQINLSSQWAWHGNWQRDQYDEQGPQGLLPPRNTAGDVLTLGVKYAF